MSLPGRGLGAQSRIIDLLKHVSYPGPVGPTSPSGRVLTFNTVNVNNWFPSPFGYVDDMQTFYISEDSYYSIYFDVLQPNYTSGGIGFGNGWSGTGSGSAWIRTNRYGDEGLTGWGPAGDTPDYHEMSIGPLKRYLYKDDYIQFCTQGGATGIGVVDWNATAQIVKLRS